MGEWTHEEREQLRDLLAGDLDAARCYRALIGDNAAPTLDDYLACYASEEELDAIGDQLSPSEQRLYEEFTAFTAVDPIGPVEPARPARLVAVPAALVESINRSYAELQRHGYAPPDEDQLYRWLQGATS